MTAPSTDGAAIPVELAPSVVAEHPLTRTQQLVWASQRIAPRTPVANMAKIVRLAGSIDPDRFRRAFDDVVRASDAMRTVIVDRPGQPPVARVLARPPASTEVVDLPVAELDGWCTDRISTPVDAATAAYDSVLLRHADDDWTWWFDLHHVITDAWSSALLFDRVATAYEDGDAGDVPSFYDHVAATTAPADDRRRADRARFWADQIDDAPPIAPYGPRGARTSAVDRIPVLDASEASSALLGALDGPYRTISHELGLLALLSTATATTLSRLDGRRIVTLGVPIHHRSGPAARDVIGPLMELSPLRIEVDLDETAAEAFERVYRTIVAVLRNAKPSESPTARFDAVVNIVTARYGDFAGVPASTTWARSGHVDPAHPIRIHADRYGDRLTIEADLNHGLSDDGSHRRLPRHLGRMLDAMLADPDARLGGVDLITGDERAVLAALNPPPVGGVLRPVHVAVADALAASPDAVTITDSSGDVTAGRLDERATELATWLVGRGVAVGDRIGIRMPRSADVVVAVHAVMRAGGAFVLLDPGDPAGRHEAIAADARLALVLDELPADLPPGDPARLPPPVGLDDLAYVLYTSGSTGTPKGVPISHRGLADYLRFATDTYTTEQAPVMALHSSPAFDLTITSLFLPQLAGGRTVVVDGDAITALTTLAERDDVTVLKATPSQLEILTRLVDRQLPVEVVIVGGEAFRRPVADAFAERCAPGVRIYNEYGPTEAVVGCMIHRYDPAVDLGPDVPIGRACPGAQVHVLDRGGARTPIGAWGELYVARPGMAERYLGLPELSAERFAALPAIGSQPLYRTGDRVRVTDGVVVFGGRADDQLSVGGIRLEPGEIETAIVAHPAIANAVVRMWTPGTTRIRRCVRCGLGTDVPDVTIDDDDVCSVCHSFDVVEPQTRSWFGTPADLDAIRDEATATRRGDFDALHLLSGGKDSTYALYQLVERGWRVHALTLDNGFISDGAKANVARTVADLGISHEFVTTEAMNAIFRDSLDRYANVCNGCYKAIYTLATARAAELGIPVIVTGLSRGQFFETRLVPHQFEAGRFDPTAIDATVLDARRAYHRTRDAVTELLPEQSVFERGELDVLDEIRYVDFYRYVDVELADLYRFLDERAPWVRPDDTGRSTNCLINVAGIHVHRTERGYHNYAEPYSWDVRLGHKSRDEALAELDDEIDLDDVQRMLEEVGYRPKRVEILTAWYQTVDGIEVDAAEIRAHLYDRLPERSIPNAFVHVTELPLTDSAKLDVAALPAPSRRRAGSVDYVAPVTPTEAIVADVWASVLGTDRIGRDDDFFDLGGSSLPALELIAAVEHRLDVELPDALVFRHRVLRDFAAAVDGARRSGDGRLIPELADGERPLAPAEAAMLFEHRAAPDDPRYNVMRVYTIDGTVELDAWRRALATVVSRHQPLHTTTDAERTRLSPDDAIELVDLGVVTELELDTALDELVRRPFDLDRGPLVRSACGRLADGRAVVVLGLHHVSVSAGTFDVLWSELDAAAHGRPLPALATTVAAHGEWQRGRFAESRAFWERELLARDERSGAGDLPAPTRPEPSGYLVRSTSVSPADLAAVTSTTPFAATLAAIASVLSAFSRTGIVEIGVTASTKDHPAAEPLIGCFLNTMPLRFDVPRRAPLRTLEGAVGAVVADALAHRAYPFGDVVRLARELGVEPPRIRHHVAYEHVADARWGDAPVTHRTLPTGSAVNDTTFFVREGRDGVELALEYDGRAVGAALATELLDAVAAALEHVAHRPDTPVEEAIADLLDRDVAGPTLDPVTDTVLDRIEHHAAATPDAAAIVTGDGAVTSFAQLTGGARRLAAAIAAASPDARRIGVSVGRSSDAVVAMLAAWYRGAAYVPLDPATPTDRITRIVELADVDVIVTDDSTESWFGGTPTVRASAGSASTDHHLRRPGLDDDAYVVFTSGSTGVPAGVAVTHGSLAASTAARDDVYDGRPERFLLTSSIGFDSSMVGLFWPLSTGGTVVLPGDDDVHDVDRLGDLVAAHEVTHLLMVPGLYDALLRRRADRLTTLRTAIVAGEACSASVVARHHSLLPGADLVNEYGPTEATVWATAHHCRPDDDPVPIGRPIPGVTVRVADDRQRPVARGAVGELLVAGPGVVAGYLGGRSNDAFVDVDGRRWYRTGDLVRFVAGELQFAGRVDDQLNVGGVRLEPAELEAAIGELAAVRDAVVVAADVAGRTRLVAHVVADGALDADRVRIHLAERLAATAVPDHIAFHDALPRTAHGKLDRTAATRLPVVAEGEPVAPDAVGGLSELWAAVLGRPGLGPDADFFALGGDSIAAVELVTALAARAGRDVQIASLLTAPTPALMAEALGIATADPPGSAHVVAVTLRPGRSGGPLVVLTAAWDDVQGYRDLADALTDDVRVLAIAVTDPGDGFDRLGPVGDAAESLVRDACTGRPRVVVAGWSIGGVVAVEVGQRLGRAGIDVELIALVDTYFPGEHRRLWANRWSKYRSLLRPGRFGAAGRELTTMLGRRARRIAARLGRRLLRWAGEAPPATSGPSNTSPGGIPYAALDDLPVTGPVPVVLYHAATTSPSRNVHPWSELFPDLEVVEISGRHRGVDSIMAADRVTQITDDLSDRLGHAPRRRPVDADQ